MGWYKRTPIVALQQAKLYPPRQAAMAAVHEPQYTGYSFSTLCTAAPCVLRHLVYCGTDAPQFESFYTIPLLILTKTVKGGLQDRFGVLFCSSP